MKRPTILLVTSLVAAGVVLSQPPIPQDPGYHVFADVRDALTLPNAHNVLSNLPFLLVGVAGVRLAWLRRGLRGNGAWLGLFLGIALTALGSAWYHLAPSNDSLVWDRLPMALGFMALFAGIIGERISEHAYRLLLWPLIGLGVASVLYWRASEAAGTGDLRLYILVQFFPLLMIPLIMAFYEPRYSHGAFLIYALVAYGAAKALEVFDVAVFSMTGGIVAGHALKHLAAALGCWLLYLMYRDRAPLVV